MSPERPNIQSTVRRTILFAEDSESDRMLVEFGFEEARLPFFLQFVSDGLEAIDYLCGRGRYGNRANFPFPCLLLTDLKMPRMDGFELLTWVGAQETCRHLPVVVLSGSDQAEDRERAMNLGAREYVVKDLLMRPQSALFQAVLRHTTPASGPASKTGKRARRKTPAT